MLNAKNAQVCAPITQKMDCAIADASHDLRISRARFMRAALLAFIADCDPKAGRMEDVRYWLEKAK